MTLNDKARRLLTTGRIHVPDVHQAVVDGDTGQWTVTWTDDEWTCDCPGFTYRRSCAHAAAVRAVTRPPAAAA